MKLAITEIFCEILTGLATTLVVLTWLDWLNVICFKQVWITIKPYSGLATLTGVIIAAYLLGVILDAFGLVFDSLFDRFVCADEPTPENKKGFWTTANVHVLSYRDNIWAYYFCYRNLLILLLPALIASFGSLWSRKLTGWAWFTAIALVLLGVVLFFSMRTLLKIYYDITKCFLPNSSKENENPTV
jgi:hypothetical protein